MCNRNVLNDDDKILFLHLNNIIVPYVHGIIDIIYAGKEFAWHHIVEQSQTGKRASFAPELIHNTYNIVRIPSGHNSIHAKISAFYSSKQDFTGGIIVRDWLATKAYDYQYDFGIRILEQYGKLIPTNNGWTFKSF